MNCICGKSLCKRNTSGLCRKCFGGKVGKLSPKDAVGVEFPADYQEIFIRQEGMCQICGRNQVDLKSPLKADYTFTGKDIFGLLCNDCSKGISSFKNNPALLMIAASYLEDK